MRYMLRCHHRLVSATHRWLYYENAYCREIIIFENQTQPSCYKYSLSPSHLSLLLQVKGSAQRVGVGLVGDCSAGIYCGTNI